jgi:acetone carboxylase gamma subunit
MTARTEGRDSATLPKEVVKDLIEGRLDPDTLKTIQSQPKDEDRFEKVLAIEQERVPWPEKIILPLQEHLYVVLKGVERIVKCSCGHEFGDCRQNWKLNALVYERDTQDGEIFRGPQGADPEWMVLREFYCPGCATQLDVECVCPGHPLVFNQQADIDGFYALRPNLKKKVFGEAE